MCPGIRDKMLFLGWEEIPDEYRQKGRPSSEVVEPPEQT